MNRELPDVQAGFRKGRGTRDQIAGTRARAHTHTQTNAGNRDRPAQHPGDLPDPGIKPVSPVLQAHALQLSQGYA